MSAGRWLPWEHERQEGNTTVRAGRFSRSRRVFVLGMVFLVSVAFGVPAVHADHVEVRRFEGANRYETAAAVADAAAPDGADTVFLARGDRFPDALVAAFGAGHTGGPVLLTRQRAVPEVTMDSLARLEPGVVVLLGEQKAISRTVAKELRREGHDVERVGGSTRYETAAAVARRYGSDEQRGVDTPGGDEDRVGSVYGRRTALLASGERFRDALVAAPLAAGAHFPLLLTERRRYPPEVSDALAALDIEQVLIVGDTTAVDHAVHEALEEEGYEVDRLGDPDDHGTAAVVAQFAIYTLRWSLGDVFFIDRRSFASALAAVSLAGQSEGAVMLTDRPAEDAAEGWFTALCPRIGSIKAIGGPQAVPYKWHDDAAGAADACAH